MNVAFAQTRQYYFVDTPLNWTDAQSFCRQFYTDLATVENTADVSAVISTTSNHTGKFSVLVSCSVIKNRAAIWVNLTLTHTHREAVPKDYDMKCEENS